MQGEEILLKDVMTTSPKTIQEDSRFSLVEKYFRLYHIRHLPVVDSNNVLQGIITQRDLYRVCSPRKTIEGEFVYSREEMDNFILKQVMIKNPLALSPQDNLAKALKLMVSTKYGCIPIVDEGKKIVGIITQIDVLKAIYEHYMVEK